MVKRKRLFYVVVQHFRMDAICKWVISDKSADELEEEILKDLRVKKIGKAITEVREIERVSSLLKLGMDGDSMVVIENAKRHRLEDDNKRIRLVISIPEYDE